jgi:3-dehydroquinate synthetase
MRTQETQPTLIESKTNTSPLTTHCPENITLVTENGHFGYRVNDGGHVYDVMRCDGVFCKFNPVLARRIGSRRVFVVEDPKVHELYGQEIRSYFEYYGIECFRFALPLQQNNELNKDMAIAAEISTALQDSGLRHSDLIILVGGGVVKDVGAFVAKAFRRGVPMFVIPTTLLAMVDAAPSPKCAVNVQGRKNLWSDRHYPEVVFYDPRFLTSLNDDEFREGLAEIAKVAIIGSENLFHHLETQSVSALRKELCSETAVAMLADAVLLFLALKWTGPYYGNQPASIRSFGHGFEREMETLSGFSLRHGSAVSVEMFTATRLARNLGKLEGHDCMRIQALLCHLGLPATSEFCNADIIWERVFRRRWADGVNFYYPIPTRVGSGGFLDCFSFEDFSRAINDLE